jgi:hypothetical protein
VRVADEDVERLKRERDEAVERAREAERRAAFPAKAVAAGVPAELVNDFDHRQSDAEVEAWVSRFDSYCAKRIVEELTAYRPDRRRDMLVQNFGDGRRGLALAPGTLPDRLTEKVNELLKAKR